MEKQRYIKVKPEAGRVFFTGSNNGPIVMLNLLKFNDIADYADAPKLKPAQPITGEKAYELYMTHTLPLLKEAGGELIFNGNCNSFLIGPENEKWDAMLLVRHVSKLAFLAFASNKEYLKGEGHRTAALQDSRLLPIQ